MIRFYRFIGALGAGLILIAATPAPSFAGVFFGVGITVGFAPPPIPVYVQPPVLVADDIWTPGYWAYGNDGYYWVPGTWVAAPVPGYLWTPGYWGFAGGAYAWHAGYWGPHVGFYGGVNYGFGYTGNGYVGGAWNGNHFAYNTAVTNVNRTTINNVYVNRTVINNYDNTTVNRVSYNGGPRGVQATPSAEEAAYQNERHLPPTPVQQTHIQTAAQNRSYLASVNNGRPAEAAVEAPLDRTAVHAPQAFDRFNEQRGTAPDAYHPQSAYREPNAYHEQSAYRQPNPGAYHAAPAPHPANAYRAPHEAPPHELEHNRAK